MTDNIQSTIYTVAQTDADTSAEKLELLRAVCALPENAVALSAALSAVRRASRPSHLVRSCEARRILGGEGTPVSHGTLRNLVRAGRLHTYGPNRWRLYSTAELEALMAPGEEGEA
jgi:hypothetical protein